MSILNAESEIRFKRAPASLLRNSFESRMGGRVWLGWSLAGLLLTVLLPFVGLATESEREPVSAAPALPMPAPVDREELPAALLLESPRSLDDLRAMEEHVKELVARVAPAVVAVRINGTVGSGVVISEDGWVLSAAHVSGTPDRDVRFTFPDGKSATGKTLGTNHRIDSGLMKITEPGPWAHVEIGDLSQARSGDWVLALGHPGGFDPERSMVVRLGRIIRVTPGVVQTDAPLIGGDSGGPLFDMHGRVIGIHSRISDSTAANFHVPIRTFFDTWDRLAQGDNWGDLRSGPRVYVGVRGGDHPEGCLIEWVQEDGPAARAGLREGDIVLAVNGEEIADFASFRRQVFLSEPGDELRIEIKRVDERMAISVKVEARRRR